MTEPPFSATREDRVDRTILRFAGELDAACAGDVRAAAAAAMDQAAGRRLVLDLSAVTFLDSSTIASILWAHDRSRKRNTSLWILAPEGTRAARVLDLAGIGSVVRIVGSLDTET